MSKIKFPTPKKWDRTPDEWLRDVLREAGVTSGLLEDATEQQRAQAAALLVQRAFMVGSYFPDTMEPLPAMCKAAHALVKGAPRAHLEEGGTP